MKCTNFREELALIKYKEEEELKKALEQHGGSYSFGNYFPLDEFEEYPSVIVRIAYDPIDLLVTAAKIEDGTIYLDGRHWDECGLDEVVTNVQIADVFVGEIMYIIQKMKDIELANK